MTNSAEAATLWTEVRDAYWYDHKGREATLAFQDAFRRQAATNIKAWFEVVRWKSPRSAGRTISHITRSGIKPNELHDLCEIYVQCPTLGNFQEFRRCIAKTDVVATAATFPAFLRPDLFPMVDTQTALWAGQNRWARIAGVSKTGQGVLYERHWEYVKSWIQWCYKTAELLGSDWTPRDVEMAVFTAQRSGRKLPRLK